MIPSLDMDYPMGKLEPGYHPPGLWSAPAYIDNYGEIATDAIWLRTELISRLAIALGSLVEHKLGLLVWDGWRSPELQRALYTDFSDLIRRAAGLSGPALTQRVHEFASDPDRDDLVPAHMTGGAVDLTLCDRDGQPLDMGGEFDELTDRSRSDYYEGSSKGGAELYSHRRALLHSAMGEAGYSRLDSEWWHFEYGTTLWAEKTGGQTLFGPLAPA